MTAKILTVLILLLLVLALPGCGAGLSQQSPAPGSTPGLAQESFARGKAAYEAHDYDQAIPDLTKALRARPMDPAVQINKSIFEPSLILLPRYAVYSRCSFSLQ